MRDYGKVQSKFWESETTRSMSDDGRMLALYLLTCKHNTIAGVFRLPDGYVCEDIQWSSARVTKGFTELLAKGFANRCETTKWVWINKHFEWNPPENPNQKKAAAKQANSVPAECRWRAEFIDVCANFVDKDSLIYLNPCETLSEPLPNQDQNQEQYQKQDIPPPKTNGKKKTKTQFPQDFELTPELAGYVEKQIPDAEPLQLFESFKGKALAKGWQYVSWSQAFQEFVRNAAPNSGHFASGQYPKKTSTDPFAGMKWT